MHDKLRGTIEMTAAMTLSGTIGWLVVISGEPVTTVVLWRCIFGVAALLVACSLLGLLRGALSTRVVVLAVAGGVALVLNWMLLFAAFPRASISIATAVYSTQPFMLVALGALLLSEKPSAGALAWLGLAFVGVVLILQAKPSASYVGSDYATGIVLALAAAFFYAIAAIVAKRLSGTPPHLIMLIQLGTGILVLAPFATTADVPADIRSWLILATLGIVHTGLMFTLQYDAIQRLPTPVIGSLTFIYPVAAIVVDLLAFGHRMHPIQLAGAGAIILAAIGMNLGWSFRPPRVGQRAP